MAASTDYQGSELIPLENFYSYMQELKRDTLCFLSPLREHTHLRVYEYIYNVLLEQQFTRQIPESVPYIDIQEVIEYILDTVLTDHALGSLEDFLKSMPAVVRELLSAENSVVPVQVTESLEDWICQEMTKPYILVLKTMLKCTDVQLRIGLRICKEKGDAINFETLLDTLMEREKTLINLYVGTRKYAFSPDVKIVLLKCYEVYKDEPTPEQFDQQYDNIKGTGIEHLMNKLAAKDEQLAEKEEQLAEKDEQIYEERFRRVKVQHDVNAALEEKEEVQRMMNVALGEIINEQNKSKVLWEERVRLKKEKVRAEQEKVKEQNKAKLLEEEKVRAEQEKVREQNKAKLLEEEKVRAEQEKVRAEQEKVREQNKAKLLEEEKVRAEQEKVREQNKAKLLEEEKVRAEQEKVREQNRANLLEEERLRAQIRAELLEQEKIRLEEEKRIMREQFEKEKKQLLYRIQQCVRA